MIRNSIRQLFRTRVRTLLFFLLITLCSMIICLGGNLYRQSRVSMEHFKDAFVTIGTVEQNPDTYVKYSSYDAYTKQHTYSTVKQYNEVFDLSKLDMEGVEYISGPERRAFYSTYLPEYRLIDEKGGYGNRLVVEVSPYEDGIPDKPIKVKVKRVLYGIYQLNVDYIYYCDHYNDNPQMMYADKTYIMSVDPGYPHGFGFLEFNDLIFEYVQNSGLYSLQTDADGNRLETDVPEIAFEEVNDEFYAKNHDKYWEALAKEMEYVLHWVPVTATDDLNLMMPFYSGDVTVTKGEVFSEEDMEQGNAVCLISFPLSYRNKIKIGDTITLPLRVANYSDPPIRRGGFSSLRADGTNFETFFTADYTVKGIYNSLPTGGTDLGYQLEENEIIIPRKSIKADDSDNIGEYGNHVSPFNTSFRIPNGTIASFMEQWEAQGDDSITIHFYDRGYSKLMDGIEQMENMAILLLTVGVVLTILVLIFFCSMMIMGQKKRTAIERSLGADKKTCVQSLLYGILLVAAVGCIIGCTAGMLMTGSVSSSLSGQQIFDRNFSAGIVYSEVEETQPMSGNIPVSLLALAFVFGFTTLVSGIAVWRNLRYEPLELLSGKDNE